MQASLPLAAARKKLRRTLLLFISSIGAVMFATILILNAGVRTHEALRIQTISSRAASAIEREFTKFFIEENKRPVEHYSFFNLAQNKLFKQQASLGFSPLSNPVSLTPTSAQPAYFQISSSGEFETPYLPKLDSNDALFAESYISEDELTQRKASAAALQKLLANTRIGSATAAEPAIAPAASSGGATRKSFGGKVLTESQQVQLPGQGLRRYYQDQYQTNGTEQPKPDREVIQALNLSPGSVDTFESFVSPLVFAPIDDTYGAFVRTVTQRNRSSTQGFAVPLRAFINHYVTAALGQLTDERQFTLSVVRNGETLAVFASSITSSATFDPMSNKVVLRRPLPIPLPGTELVFAIAPGSIPYVTPIALWLGALAALVLGCGSFALHRAGLQQLDLAEQRTNFVSAVSHELKTPLTAIRMYAEMLQGSMVLQEEKRKQYYDYIFNESERLSRLVHSVLAYANISQGKGTEGKAALNLAPHTPDELLSAAEEKVRALVESAGFSLVREAGAASEHSTVMADRDSVLQILINLFENSCKFAAQAAPREIRYGWRTDKTGTSLYVRDFGPGVDARELKRIFEPFFRAESELTRTTRGTGLGLGLAAELARAMDAHLEAVLIHPGLEVRLRFKTQSKQLRS